MKPIQWEPREWALVVHLGAPVIRRQVALFFASLVQSFDHAVERWLLDMATMHQRRPMGALVERMNAWGWVRPVDLADMEALGMNVPMPVARMVVEGNPPPVDVVVELATAYHTEAFTKAVMREARR